MTIFGNTFLLGVEGKRLRSLELYFDTVGGENRTLRRFEFKTINVATQNFSEYNKISRWGDGSMYKGILQNGKGILIARHDSDFEWQDYKNEVALLVKLEHENLLRLYGYSIKGTRVFVVYEFAVYSSLDRMLFDPECKFLYWNRRNKILLDVARALLYLHQHDVIHGNVTPGNILLDENFNPKLSDFGLARRLALNEADCFEVDIAEMNRIHGTLGDNRRYLAPEYSSTGHLSTKADVFSFGVLIFEIISGFRIFDYVPSSNMTLLKDIFSNWLEGTCSSIIDPRIRADSSIITRFIHVGLLCVQLYRDDRPTMEEVVGLLTDTSSLTLPLPKIYLSHWMLEEYSVCKDVVRTDAAHTDAVYIDPAYTSAILDQLLVDDYDHGAVLEFISELHPGEGLVYIHI